MNQDYSTPVGACDRAPPGLELVVRLGAFADDVPRLRERVLSDKRWPRAGSPMVER